MTPSWPRTGRCTACLEPAEQYPSGRWRHLNAPCPWRSGWLQRPGDLPSLPVKFIPDGDPDPTPSPGSHSTVEYEEGIPVRINLHSPETVAEYWDRLRAAVKEAT